MSPGPEIHPGLRAVNELHCRCGLIKERYKVPFCNQCYHRLPRALRRALQAQRGEGYLVSYDAACQALDDSDLPTEGS